MRRVSVQWNTIDAHLFVDARDEYAEQEDDTEGRGDVAGHCLDVDEQLGALGGLDEWDPQNTQPHQ